MSWGESSWKVEEAVLTTHKPARTGHPAAGLPPWRGLACPARALTTSRRGRVGPAARSSMPFSEGEKQLRGWGSPLALPQAGTSTPQPEQKRKTRSSPSSCQWLPKETSSPPFLRLLPLQAGGSAAPTFPGICPSSRLERAPDTFTLGSGSGWGAGVRRPTRQPAPVQTQLLSSQFN